MSYEMCLKKAGANVLAFKKFGDYQGTWYAFVEYNGERGWVEGNYGSCSGCDAFESEFDGAYNDLDIEERYAEFGRSYLTVIMPHDEQIKMLASQIANNPNSWYAGEFKEIIDWMVDFELTLHT